MKTARGFRRQGDHGPTRQASSKAGLLLVPGASRPLGSLEGYLREEGRLLTDWFYVRFLSSCALTDSWVL